MCGIIGFTGKNVTHKDLEILKKVMLESRIRGKHASGIAWYNGRGDILSVVEPIPIDELIEKFGDFKVMVHDGQLSMIAHARYSTSDIRYNQPIVGKNFAIAHNGVITQTPPETWKKTYGYDCETCNDSELILRCFENGDDPIEKFKNSSIAGVMLDDGGGVICFRNSIRPVWVGKIGSGTVIASTYDILHRAGVSNIKKFGSMSDTEDLQRRCMKQWKIQRKPIITSGKELVKLMG